MTESRYKRCPLTKPQKLALEWLKANEPVSMFPCDGSAPSLKFVHRLVKIGLVEKVGKEAGSGAALFTRFAVSDAGRAALRSRATEERDDG